MSNLDVKIRRQKSYPYCGRLIVLDSIDSQKPLEPFSLENNFSVDFPAMPESLDLARQAEYKIVSNMVVPDGVHQYRYTSPMSIPFNFSLHSLDDEYCKDGSLTVLQVAARLHALTVPFGDSTGQIVTVANDAPLTNEGRPQPDAVSPKNDANAQAKSQAPNDPTFQAATNAKFDPPATVRLELMFTKEAEPGIICTGYLRDVRTLFWGPWLRGPNASRAFNMPTSCDYSFTFVHHPAHYNAYNNPNGIQPTQQVQTFADHILRNFYNTRGLAGGGDYRGFTTKS